MNLHEFAFLFPLVLSFVFFCNSWRDERPCFDERTDLRSIQRVGFFFQSSFWVLSRDVFVEGLGGCLGNLAWFGG
ncbi:hypothetical protein BDV97DRAFT_347716, partial [Delphinella strobiligena]